MGLRIHAVTQQPEYDSQGYFNTRIIDVIDLLEVLGAVVVANFKATLEIESGEYDQAIKTLEEHVTGEHRNQKIQDVFDRNGNLPYNEEEVLSILQGWQSKCDKSSGYYCFQCY